MRHIAALLLLTAAVAAGAQTASDSLYGWALEANHIDLHVNLSAPPDSAAEAQTMVEGQPCKSRFVTYYDGKDIWLCGVDLQMHKGQAGEAPPSVVSNEPIGIDTTSFAHTRYMIGWSVPPPPGDDSVHFIYISCAPRVKNEDLRDCSLSGGSLDEIATAIMRGTELQDKYNRAQEIDLTCKDEQIARLRRQVEADQTAMRRALRDLREVQRKLEVLHQEYNRTLAKGPGSR